MRPLQLAALALSLVTACNSRGTRKCDIEATTALATQLDAADPLAQPDLLTGGLEDICRLPPFYSHWLALMKRERGLPFLGNEALEDQREVVAKLCPALAQTPSLIADAPVSQRAAKLYDTCKLGRLDVVSRDDYVRYQPASLVSWAGYQWLRDQGVSSEAAASITRALLVLERRHDIEGIVGEGVRVPKVEGATLPRAGLEAVVSMGTDELVLSGEQLATLEAGRLDPGQVGGHVIMALYDKLDEEHAKQREVDEARGLPFEPRMLLAIDGRVPFASIQDLAYTVERSDVEGVGLLAEVGPWIWEPLPVEFPRSKLRRDGPGDGRVALMITIDDQGFAVRDQADSRATLEHIGPDPAMLATRAEQHRAAHPKTRLAAISPGESVEFETIAQAIVALRGPSCRTHVASADCRLPTIVLMGAGATAYDPLPPPEEPR